MGRRSKFKEMLANPPWEPTHDCRFEGETDEERDKRVAKWLNPEPIPGFEPKKAPGWSKYRKWGP